jgi:hypothetical protein
MCAQMLLETFAAKTALKLVSCRAEPAVEVVGKKEYTGPMAEKLRKLDELKARRVRTGC